MAERPRVLMTAFHYPPLVGSSGVHRTLTFSRYLGDAGWDPVVLSAHPRAYQQTGEEQLKDIPESVPVHRAFALDTSRHLAIRGRYPGLLALPDPWISWALGAIPAGIRLVRRHQPRAIWTTYPIATAHLIGYALHRLTKLPWIADFRDSMTEPGYPAEKRKFRCYRWLERKAVTHAARCVFTTPGAVRMYRERYPDVDAQKHIVLPNGYDEASFADAEAHVRPRKQDAPVTLVHSGILYPSERDPRQFFAALAELKAQGALRPGAFRVVLRSSGSEDFHREHIAKSGVEDLVFLEPGVPYREALCEMMEADGLLLFQASNCNHQVPAKVYEYLRARRPILALTDPAGDTAAVLRDAGVDTIARLDSKDRIVAGLTRFLALVRDGGAPLADDEEVARHSRRARTDALARLLDEVAEIERPATLPVGA